MKNRTKHQNHQELKNLQTIYDYWFMQFEFPNEEGKPYKSSGGKMVYNEELKREIPEGWKAGKIKDICSIKSGFAFESESYAEHGDYKLITIKNVQDGYIDSNNTTNIYEVPNNLPDFCKLKDGDILMSLTGNVGRIGLVSERNLLLNQRVGIIIPSNDSYHSLLYLFRNTD